MRDLIIKDSTVYVCAPVRARFRVRATVSSQFSAEGEDMQITMGVTQQVALAIGAPVDRFGNPTSVDGLPRWSVSDDTKLALAVADDGMSATVRALGPMGQAQVVIKGDADLGEGVAEITSVVDFDLHAGQAVGFSVSAGTPVEQTAPQ